MKTSEFRLRAPLSPWTQAHYLSLTEDLGGTRVSVCPRQRADKGFLSSVREREMGRVSRLLGEGPMLQQATGQVPRPPQVGRRQYQSQGVMGLEGGVPQWGCGPPHLGQGALMAASHRLVNIFYLFFFFSF